MINFDNIKIIKTIGTGFAGTVYLCKYEGKLYALKIQHILEKDKTNINYPDMWREVDLYNFINNMKAKDQVFFTKLYEFKIYDNCKHEQKRPFEIEDQGKLEKFKNLDESDWCVKYLIDYKGDMTLATFLTKYINKIKLTHIYSILLQIIHIIMLLYYGGYSHNDLYGNNIMITKTNKPYFIMNGTKIKYCGIQLSAVDYGTVLHNKYNLKVSYLQVFFINREQWLFMELFRSLMHIISNSDYSVNYCRNKNIAVPWEINNNFYYNGIKLVFENHIDFCNTEIKKYIELFPEGTKELAYFLKFYNTKNIKPIIEKANNYYLKFILNRLIFEFDIKHPRLYKQYFGWCCETRWILPKAKCLDILLLNNTHDLINYFISKN